jgi:two-component system response regulator BaeR
MNQTILIVEDEPQLASILADYLHAAGFNSHIIDNGLTVTTWVKENKPALILLDLMLPGKDGLEICKELRQSSAIPVMMLTAKIEEIDRLLGLELGADDYICKPYSPREVVARVKAVLRRFQPPTPSMRGIVIDKDRLKVTVNGEDTKLTTVEFELFTMLFEKPGYIFSRDRIMDEIYQDHRVVSDRTIDSHIKKVRKKMQRLIPDDDVIYSVYGAGYKFEPTA